MENSNKIYAWSFSASLILIPLFVVLSILTPELIKEGMASEAALSTAKTALLGGLILCGIVLWCYAIQRLAYVWKWSSTSKKISGVVFVIVFPGVCGLYQYYLDSEEIKREARKAARRAQQP